MKSFFRRAAYVSIAVWLLMVHLAALFLVVKEPEHRIVSDALGVNILPVRELSDYSLARRQFLKRQFRHGPWSGVWFVGDSRIEGMNVSAICDEAVNLGVGGDTSRGVLERIGDYEPLDRATLLVLAIGINDLKHRSAEEAAQNIRRILEIVVRSTDVLVVSVLPIDETARDRIFSNEDIARLNSLLSDLVAEYRRAEYLDIASLVSVSGQLNDTFHIGDGLHLNYAGQFVVIEALKEKIGLFETALPAGN